MSIVLAKIFGLYFLAIGIAFIINPDRFRKLYPQIVKDENFPLFGGLLALIFGAIIVAIHNVWILGWPLIITLLGWWSLIKGFALIVQPNSIKLFSFIENRSDMFYRGISLVYILVGLFLLYKGFA